MKGFYFTAKGQVKPEWIDVNGHMNVTAYMSLFDSGTEKLLNRCGIPDISNDITVVAGRVLIDFKKELFEGEDWELWSGIVAVNSTNMTITHRLRSDISLRTICDIQGVSFSKHTRTANSLDKKTLNTMNEFIVPGLIDRFNL